jgi:GT2 family glycosyltransferase
VEKLLADLQAFERPPDRVVVVDNASTDGSLEMLREQHPDVHLIANPKNLGGSGGFNAGMRWGLEQGGFDYFWLLDNDVVVHEGALANLLAPAEADPGVGIVGSRIGDLGRPGRTQEIGARVDWTSGTFVRQGDDEADDPVRRLFDVDYVAACSLLARVRAVEDVGIWDEGHFVFLDDIDWGLRFKRLGWKVIGAAASLVEHEDFWERRLVHSLTSEYYWVRNELCCYHRHCPPARRPRLFFRMFRERLGKTFQWRGDGRDALARVYELGIWDFFRSARGPCPHTFADETLPHPRGGAAEPSVPNRRKRILLWSISGSAETGELIQRVRRRFPGHSVDVFVPPEIAELGELEIEGAIRRPTMTRGDRVKLAGWVRGRYDAVAHDQRRPRLLFEFLFPVAIWYSPDGEVSVTRNRRVDLARIALGRMAVFAAAAALTAAALIKPRTKADYFAWRRERSTRSADTAP